jgi:hypothetical protein
MGVLQRIDQPFRNGLLNGRKVPANAEMLAELVGAHPTPAGLEPHRDAECGISLTAANWPYFQLFRGQRITLLVRDNLLYSLNETTWATTALTVYDPATDNATTLTAGGGPWHFADFGDFWVLANDANMVYRQSAYIGDPKVVYKKTSPVARTVCSFRGRGLMANLPSWGSGDWATYWDDHSGESLPTDIPWNVVTLGARSIVWDSIIGGHFLMWLDPSLATEGYLGTGTEANTTFDKALRQNQTGTMDVPWQEGVLALWPHENGVLVFTTENVGYLTPVGVTFGFRTLSDVGIPSRGAVGGTASECVWVDRQGKLWHMPANGGPEDIGYENIFDGMSTLMVSHNPFDKEFYISSASKAYSLNRHGLSELPYSLSSAARVGDRLLGGVFPRDEEQGFVLESNTYDLGVRLPKSIAGLRLGARNPEYFQASVKYRADAGGVWHETDRETPKPDGYVSFARPVSAVEFRVRLTSEEYADVDLDFIEVLGGERTNYRSIVR